MLREEARAWKIVTAFEASDPDKTGWGLDMDLSEVRAG